MCSCMQKCHTDEKKDSTFAVVTASTKQATVYSLTICRASQNCVAFKILSAFIFIDLIQCPFNNQLWALQQYQTCSCDRFLSQKRF